MEELGCGVRIDKAGKDMAERGEACAGLPGVEAEEGRKVKREDIGGSEEALAVCGTKVQSLRGEERSGKVSRGI